MFIGTKTFFTRMLHALEDASIVKIREHLHTIEKLKLSLPPAVDTVHLRSQLPPDKSHSVSFAPVIDSEDQEVSDDDDRNHKHRRREAQANSFDNDVQEPSMRQINRKRSRPLEGRKMFHDSNNNSNIERDVSSSFEKRRPMFMPGIWGPSYLGSWARINQRFCFDTGSCFGNLTATGRPPVGKGRGRGRGRSIVSWSQQDSRFNPINTLDFASQVVSQGLPTHPGLFVGTGIPNAATTQNASWGTYGFVPGMSNRILDPLQPLGLQGNLQSTITPLFNMGMPRQRCRDFDEQGFCLRGDMCPMEHGVNRIVVEDVQVAILQDHFSSFGDLASIVMEEHGERSENEGMKTPENFCAHVTFTSCDSAERAYVGGQCWQGHNLHFMWLSESDNSNKVCGSQETLGPPESSSADIQDGPVASVMSSLTEGTSADGVICKVTVVEGESNRGVEDIHCYHGDMLNTTASDSNPNRLSWEEHQSTPDVSVAEDKMSIDLAK
ncbi:hypothetical protein BHM03_00049792 [Ensete ventricosum]|uniref:C3H1-type domain-containing protein n=1 Tax=Ensete ventricosum TaxID=4639 RepID=A0A426ZJ07_ENSVE|nr:hypothetical protein B296_00042259 [Ensete ventricosum]RZS17629.1 hypothetical protein BHM03_00049792 [Ensete ventricosum]